MAETRENTLKTENSGKSLEPSLINLIQNDKLRWVFVGGKGGTGKTTICCSVALRLAEVRRSVLLLSTDPSHDVSHAFEQNFTRTPTKVSNVDNLFVMEIDLEQADGCLPDNFFDDSDSFGLGLKKMLTDTLDSIPGVKLALVVYIEILKMMSSPNPEYDVVVFDTVPGGQTAVSLDCLPDALEALFSKAIVVRDHFLPFLSIFQGMQEVLSQGVQVAMDRFTGVLDSLKQAKSRLRTPEETTFLAVCTPDFMSVYETEEMIQQLCKRNIDCRNVIVNQSLLNGVTQACKVCHPRQQTQAKYVKQIHDLYEDFHVVEVPLVGNEIKGPKLLKELSNYMFK